CFLMSDGRPPLFVECRSGPGGGPRPEPGAESPMPIIGRIEVLKRSDRQRLDELSGVRGFDGEFDRGYYIKSLPEGAEHSPQISARFLDAARVQQKLGDRGARHWPPILFTGAGDHGPYYVTEYYPASA